MYEFSSKGVVMTGIECWSAVIYFSQAGMDFSEIYLCTEYREFEEVIVSGLRHYLHDIEC